MELKHEPERIFFLDQAGKTVAEVTFPQIRKGVVDINHTFVDDSLRGQGIASRLMEEVVKTLREEGKQAVLTCSYAKKWFSDHKEYSDLQPKQP
ncbi:GNAT family N-acetyltransferase [Caproicibacter sp.]|uniref:GNAT family N-acetyltransferase n=1 Tax=Caproicibacter sp. TaxID=2814884 RepID=UPI0039896F54